MIPRTTSASSRSKTKKDVDVTYGPPQSANELQSNLPRRSRHLMAKFSRWLQTLHIGSGSKYVCTRSCWLSLPGWLVCLEMCFCPWIYSNFPIIFLWSGCPPLAAVAHKAKFEKMAKNRFSSTQALCSTEGSRLMRISLVRISLLGFFKTFH